MKVIGGIAILIAVLLGLGAFFDYSNAAKLRNSIDNQTGLAWVVGLGTNGIDELRIRAMENEARNLAIGAGVLGVVGLVMCGRDD